MTRNSITNEISRHPFSVSSSSSTHDSKKLLYRRALQRKVLPKLNTTFKNESFPQNDKELLKKVSQLNLGYNKPCDESPLRKCYYDILCKKDDSNASNNPNTPVSSEQKKRIAFLRALFQQTEAHRFSEARLQWLQNWTMGNEGTLVFLKKVWCDNKHFRPFETIESSERLLMNQQGTVQDLSISSNQDQRVGFKFSYLIRLSTSVPGCITVSFTPTPNVLLHARYIITTRGKITDSKGRMFDTIGDFCFFFQKNLRINVSGLDNSTLCQPIAYIESDDVLL